MILVNPTTPAQYFHILRKQVLGRVDIPLIVFTPKSLLRLPSAQSTINDFTDGEFKEIIDDEIVEKKKITNVLITSGKVYYDLLKYKKTNPIESTAIIRLEQYYPFNFELMNSILSRYSNAKKFSWVQEEPKNMGAWNFVFVNLYNSLPKNLALNYIGREESPSPASGSNKEYTYTQEELIKKSFQ
jgi:2-oxoglutarate dehydrogenase E1 component